MTGFCQKATLEFNELRGKDKFQKYLRNKVSLVKKVRTLISSRSNYIGKITYNK